MKDNISTSFFWKLMERFGVSGIQFVLQLVLARLLDPEHYGVLAIMVIFTSIANVFIQAGFNTSLIQNRDVTDDDYSSVLWVSLLLAALLYGIIFMAAPLIAFFYKIPSIIVPLRVLALMLFPGALNSIQLAKASREMDFQKVFIGGISGVAVSGVIGVLLAYLGFGLWSLVIQNILNVVISSIVMLFIVSWRPRFICKRKRIATLFSFGWKYMVSSLLDVLDDDLWSLVVGKKFSNAVLGYYNRGNQFPYFLTSSITSALHSVLLPALSAKQDSVNEVKLLTKNSIRIISYVICPMMAGLAGIATPLIQILLTDKWLPCVPFLQITCVCMVFYPIYVSNLQAISAMGRSDIYLKLELQKKVLSLFLLLIAIFFIRTPIGIALIDAFCCGIVFYINAYPNKNLIGYSPIEQIRDILPSMLASLTMLWCILPIGKLPLAPMIVMFLQIVAGIFLYVLISIVFQLQPYLILRDFLLRSLRKRNANGQ